MRTMPNWSNPLSGAGERIFFAYDDPSHLLAVPIGLVLADNGNGAPALSLEVFGIEPAEGQLESFGLLTIRFVGDYALAERQASIFARRPEAKLLPLIPENGFLRFETAQQLSLPEELTAPRPLAWTGAGGLTFAARLDSEAIAFVAEALKGGVSLVDAVAEIEAAGLTSAIDTRARFNPALLASALERIATEAENTCRKKSLISLLTGSVDDSPVQYEDLADDDVRMAAADVLADRLLTRFAVLVPARDPGTGPLYRFDFDAMKPGEMVWDLNEPAVVRRAFILRSNPLATARDAVAQGAQLVHHQPVTPFESGLHVITLYPNLPARRSGVLMLGAEIRVPPLAPDRPQTVTASTTFRAEQRFAQVDIRLSPAESLAFDYQAVVFVNQGGRAQRLTGSWHRHADAHLTIPPNAFPVRFVEIEAEPALLRICDIAVRCTGRKNNTPWSSSTRLTRSEPAIAIGVPDETIDSAIEVTAFSHASEGTLSLAPLPMDDLWIDLSRFPGTGPQQLEIECRFDDDASFVAIECIPEDRKDGDAAAATLIRLTPQQPQREWRWLSTNPFTAGYCCRWVCAAGEPPAPWSEVRGTSAPLVFASRSFNQARVPGGA